MTWFLTLTLAGALAGPAESFEDAALRRGPLGGGDRDHTCSPRTTAGSVRRRRGSAR